ncbi:hydrogenase formation protein HypD [Romboutsia maritimum]|uniref:Hydrogenase formation protein HypD n=1 Tax=Romboutsia maritimum TaxID=2020948 RepID=A0A371IRN6_9FIRM|nr:hydrogenase formation protein HypD [Romboutsia maritimum]RDY23139.1 hydrogenase formation protein HypD [Romboutsia maritimum]
MKYVDEFRDVDITKKLINKIYKKFEGRDINKRVNIMEVCGTHTMSIYKNGIDKLLPKNINLLSGPGCPVCVTDTSYVDSAIDLSKNKNIIICTFSDMLRVLGSKSSLSNEKLNGSNIVSIYSPLDCIYIANKNKEKEVIFLGVGFETTIPIIGLTIKKAYESNINNFSLLSSLKTMPNAMKKLILDPKAYIDGFICPGHVGSVIGTDDFDKLARENNMPMVMAGFEHVDIVYAIYSLCEMIENKEYKCKNQYKRAVRDNGNKLAKNVINEVFEITNSNWRGLGNIKDTGLKIKEKYKQFDAIYKFKLNIEESNHINGCLCGEVLRGVKKPTQCKLFKSKCTPLNPIGPCMVSQEGTCANFYRYVLEDNI